jgi:uncharacterized protein
MHTYNLTKPLYHLIKTSSTHYLYDTATNQILNISSESYTHLEKNEFSYEELVDFLNYSLENNEVLSPKLPKQLLSSFSESKIINSIENVCTQLSLEVSQRCNLRCKYCVYSGQYKGKRIHSNRLMDPQIAYAAIDYLTVHSNQVSMPTIAFYGGEPLLNFALIKDVTNYALEKMSKRKVLFTVTSNGTLITPEKIRFFIQHNFHLFISLDGPKKIHDQARTYHNGKGSFDVVLRNLQMIRSSFPEYYRTNLHLSMVIQPGVDLLEIDWLLCELGISSAKIATVSEYGTKYNDEYLRKPILNETIFLEKFINAAKEGVLEMQLGTPEFCLSSALFTSSISRILTRTFPAKSSDHNLDLGICIPGNRKVFVDCDGNIYPCEKTDGSNNLLLGNILSGGVQTKLVKEIIEKFHEYVQYACKKCWLFRLCDACYIQPSWENHYDEDKFQVACNLLRKKYSIALEMYCKIMEFNPESLYCIIEEGVHLQ